ncbi:NUDIX hydrolase [Sneathiella chinensis]|uniref:NUDIX hydrolase n=1 Tax=Sneathiella chinensis TaxID=349750 RepID=A0ABQ5U9H2_9PROT|nr:NUDIX hydrolase [Sneathiella chinensis]GLQ07825.1 NUDIX hydrolase [Sneathiella chinensis]
MSSSTNPTDFGFEKKIPDGDTMERQVCTDCGWVHYENPKVVVGSVVTFEDRFLLCKRAIHPRKGFWTLPAGFMEQHETTEEGARREAREEANADIRIRDLLAVYNVTHISQVQIMYRATLDRPEFSAGEESLDVRLFSWDEIPWNDLAFPTVYWALHQFRDTAHEDRIVPFTNAEGDMLKQSLEMLKR